MESFSSLIQQLVQAMGMPEIEVQEVQKESSCSFLIDEKFSLHLQEEEGLMRLFVDVGQIQPEAREQLYPELLQANLFFQGTDGAALGVDPSSGIVVLSYQEPLQALDFPRFQAILNKFLDTARWWWDHIIARHQEIEAKEKDSNPQGASPWAHPVV